MTVCACGCGEEIPPKPYHKYLPPKYIPGHQHVVNGAKRKGKTTGAKRPIVPEGTLCACGCGTEIPHYTKTGRVRYSRAKDGKFYAHGHHPGLQREDHPMWKGGRHEVGNGYIRLNLPDHPMADAKGRVLEHRKVMAEQIGRLLTPEEVVHHRNEDRGDNRPENLGLMTDQSSHMKEHRRNPNAMATQEQRQAAGRKGAEARWGNRTH